MLIHRALWNFIHSTVFNLCYLTSGLVFETTAEEAKILIMPDDADRDP